MNKRLAAWQMITEVLFAPDDATQNASLGQRLQSSAELWPQIIGLADAQFVTPALWAALSEKNLTNALPEDARQYLSSLHDMNAERNGALLAQLDEALAALNQAGINPLIFKGAAHLKAGVYRDLGARMLTDLDILVPGEQTLDSQRVLSELGYSPLVDTTKDFSDHHHLPPVFRPGDYGGIEVHDDLLVSDAANCLPTAAVWEAATGEVGHGMRYCLLSPTHSLLMSFLHSEVADRHLKRFMISLRAMQDLLALTAWHGDAIDWCDIERRLRASGYTGLFRDYLYIAERLARRPLPAALRFGPWQPLRHRLCTLFLRSSKSRGVLDRLDALSSYRIREKYGDYQGYWARQRLRLRIVGEFGGRRLAGPGQSEAAKTDLRSGV